MQHHASSLTACLFAASLSTAAHAQPSTGQPSSGEAVFRRVCAACHLGLAQTGGATAGMPNGLGAHAVPREFLKQYPPEAILNALTNGKMQAQGSALTPQERQAVAEFASGRKFGPAVNVPLAAEAGKPCKDSAAMGDPASGPSWNGWGNGVANTRFQPASAAGITAADLPRLHLKWAFGYANVSSARTQPAVAGGRIFVASENGQVHALNPKSGCTYWTYTARAGVPTALSVGPYQKAQGAHGYALYFGDRKANAYAVDAESGAEIWVRKADEHRSAAITGAPTVYGGHVFVPVQGLGEEGLGAHEKYSCCTFRGSVTAFDASTGAVLWKTYTVPESKPRGKAEDGTPLYGPAGGGVWSSPTIDAKRGLVYIATGNGYADPPQPTTDAVLALNIVSGQIEWVTQLLRGDIWAMGCDDPSVHKAACPQHLGPDYDFSASPVLTTVAGHDLIVLPQKSGLAFALDAEQRGKLRWEYRFGRGSGLGGQWGAAIDGQRAYIGVNDVLTDTPGGLHAVNLADGQVVWKKSSPPPLCGTALGCTAAQGAAVTEIPGAVLSVALDGGLRAYSTQHGALLWTFDTNREFKTVNGIAAHGGAMDGAGPIIAGGMLYVSSGSGGFVGHPGNVLLAFGLE
jgi:polyvinyl alcohol dehydrogenase (cytochrome)